MSKKILGLDLGTNSIGWALVNTDDNGVPEKIIGMGSRIIPMTQDVLGKFDSGVSISQTAARTGFRGVRRLKERHLLRRERLHRVLNILGFLPDHYANDIDFEKKFGKFKENKEPKIAYRSFENRESLKASKTEYEFIFKNSFDEMVNVFKQTQPHLFEDGKLIPYDWTIYYLRQKALTKKIEKEELAWLLLNFNQKRGYYQLRGEDEEEEKNKLVEFHSLIVTRVEIDESTATKDEKWYSFHLENGWVYRRSSKTPLNWTGKRKDFIVTTDINADGSVKLDKDGKEKRSFRAPLEDDWTLIKKKTEKEIEQSTKTVGAYIFDTLLSKPDQKVNGKLVRTIERKFYKAELQTILKEQIKHHPELQNKTLYNACCEELYANNASHRNSISQKGFDHLFINDIIFYQRPLKSQKSSISDCKFEKKYFTKDGKLETVGIKCAPKSHPLYQEFRLWQFVQNLRIYKKEDDRDVTLEFLSNSSDWENLFIWLNNRKETDQKAFLKYPGFNLKKTADLYRWNYVEDKPYPCNETHANIVSRLEKVGIDPEFLTPDIEESLWHILYSVTDKIEIKSALNKFALRHQLTEEFVEFFAKYPPFKSEYGAYSIKALKKMLPLMRLGRFWREEAIDPCTLNRIDKIITGEYDESIKNRIREKSEKYNLRDISQFQNLPVWLASYIVYDRHSEDGENLKWKSPYDIENYLKHVFKQHSLRNPIVEQVIAETLRVVTDIWKHYGNSSENFFAEIHVELGREMKNPADKRKKITQTISQNENTNQRIKALLIELMNDHDVENVRPHSPSQQEILKIYEEGVLNNSEDTPDDIIKISKLAEPSKSELTKYKLWLDQKYRSPYTGAIIPLSKLFTSAYEIEHIIPQSRFFDDSLSNKVICEAAVNKLKDNMLGLEFIQEKGGTKLEIGGGKHVTIFSKEQYETHVKADFKNNKSKLKKLLMEDIPEDFIMRQLNDSRYISKVVKNLLSNIVREENEEETVSKNLLTTSGAVTSTLKQDWGLNEIWNEIISPRFIRLNELSHSNKFGSINPNTGKFLPQVPFELQKGFNKKRIDHRHHALDAVIIACATRDHINYLNNESALGKDKKEIKEKKRFDLRHKLCVKKYNQGSETNYKWEFNSPWNGFAKDVKDKLEATVVSFKQNLRVINKTVNYYQSYYDEAGNLRLDKYGNPQKDLTKQMRGDNWAIRKPLHKDTISGSITLQLKKQITINKALEQWQNIVDKTLRNKISELVTLKYDHKMLLKYFKDLNYIFGDKEISKVEVYYSDKSNVASRVNLDDSFTKTRIENSVADSGIQKILLNHLENYNGTKDEKGKDIAPEILAFSPDGIDDLNKNIRSLNNGKDHKPIYKVRTYEPMGNKFTVGYKGNKNEKYVEAAKGTNLYFAIYQDEKGKRSYDTIQLNVVIERLKQNLLPVPDIDKDGNVLIMYLSPNDLVYLPSPEELESGAIIDFNNLRKDQKTRIYKMVSSTSNRCYFISNNIAKSIVDKVEFTQLNKLEKSEDNISFKEQCLKLNVDRLGNIIAYRQPQQKLYPSQEDRDKSHIASEPAALYQPKLTFYADHAEQNETEAQHSASLTMQERLHQTLELIKSIYGDQSVRPDFPGIFTFKKLDL